MSCPTFFRTDVKFLGGIMDHTGLFVSLRGVGRRFIVNAPYQNDGLIEIYDLIT